MSAPNRRVPNPGFWQNKVRFNSLPQRQNYKILFGCITVLLCKLNHTTPDFVAKQGLSNESAKHGLSILWFIWMNSKFSDLDHLHFFQFDETLNIFSYRADTSIPITIVPIAVGGRKLVAYLFTWMRPVLCHRFKQHRQ